MVITITKRKEQNKVKYINKVHSDEERQREAGKKKMPEQNEMK